MEVQNFEDTLNNYYHLFKMFTEKRKENTNVYFAIGDITYDVYDISKSVLTLIKNNQYAGISTMIRLIYERYIYIVYILEEDRERRANAYNLSSYVEQNRLNYLWLNSKEIEKRAESDELIQQSLDNFKASKEKLKPLQKKFDSLYDHEIKIWYNDDNKTKNLDRLAKRIGLGDGYDTAFRFNSFEAHAKILEKHLRYNEETDTISIVSTRIDQTEIDLILCTILNNIMKCLNDYFSLSVNEI